MASSYIENLIKNTNGNKNNVEARFMNGGSSSCNKPTMVNGFISKNSNKNSKSVNNNNEQGK